MNRSQLLGLTLRKARLIHYGHVSQSYATSCCIGIGLRPTYHSGVSLRPVDPIPPVLKSKYPNIALGQQDNPLERHSEQSLNTIGAQQSSIISCLTVFGYPILRDKGRISGCSSGVQSSQSFEAAHCLKPQFQSALNNSSIFSSVGSCSDLFFMTKNFLFMTKRQWQSGSSKLSIMTWWREEK